MSKFKVGDKVECVNCSHYSFIGLGDIATVVELYRGHMILEGHRSVGFVYNEENFKLADPNPMPKLEAGMVVEVKWPHHESTKSYLSLGGDRTIDLECDIDCSQPLKDNIELVVAIHKPNKTQRGHLSLSRLNSCGEEPAIWTRTPEKTEQQKQIEELEKTINKAQEQIKEIKGE